MQIDQVVLVDKQDNKLGLMDKLEAHKGEGTLHRAISIFLYRKRNGKVELLLQQRSKDKPLWPLFWTNTVCTHPRDAESYEDCAVRRLKEEMGINVVKMDLAFVFRLQYQARYNHQLSEHELDSVFVSSWRGNYVINQQEVNAARWIDFDVVRQDVKNYKKRYTPWFVLFVTNPLLMKVLRK